MTPQYFKGDADELKFDSAGEPTISSLGLQRDQFYAGGYQCFSLGDLLFDNSRSPLANAINRTIFRQSFVEIFQAFINVGTFEAYITVFKKIFGDDVTIAFTVSAPGKLAIAITASGLEISAFVARYIADNQYNFDNVVTEETDQIVFQTVKGFTSQYELQQMLFEMVPAGIFTSITLTVG